MIKVSKELPPGVYVVRKTATTTHVEKAEMLAWYEDLDPPHRVDGYTTHSRVWFEEEHDPGPPRRGAFAHTCGPDCRLIPLYGVRPGAAPTPETADSEDQGTDVPEKPTEDNGEGSRAP